MNRRELLKNTIVGLGVTLLPSSLFAEESAYFPLTSSSLGFWKNSLSFFEEELWSKLFAQNNIEWKEITFDYTEDFKKLRFYNNGKELDRDTLVITHSQNSPILSNNSKEEIYNYFQKTINILKKDKYFSDLRCICADDALCTDNNFACYGVIYLYSEKN